MSTKAQHRKCLLKECRATEQSISLTKEKCRHIHNDLYAGGERSSKCTKLDALSAAVNVCVPAPAPVPISATLSPPSTTVPPSSTAPMLHLSPCLCPSHRITIYFFESIFFCTLLYYKEMT